MTERERSGIPWAHELALRLGILVAALVLLCCVGCVSSTPDRGGALERRDIVSTAVAATLTGVAVPQAEPTWTPTLTATPRPTLTATPEPTEMAVPTATASPGLTRSDWGQEVLPHGEIVADAMQTMGDLLSQPLPGDATWDALLAAQVVRIREADAALRKIVPPEECREAHAMLLSATGDGLLGAEYALEGVRQTDVALLGQAGEYMVSAGAKANLFRLMIEAMTP